jgi:hypothetical protein
MPTNKYPKNAKYKILFMGLLVMGKVPVEQPISRQ